MSIFVLEMLLKIHMERIFYDYSHGEMLVLCFFPDTSIRSLQIFWILERIFIKWFRGIFSYPILADHLLKALKTFMSSI
jgi:hypothetical protein